MSLEKLKSFEKEYKEQSLAAKGVASKVSDSSDYSFESDACKDDLDAIASAILEEDAKKRFILYGKALTEDVKESIAFDAQKYIANDQIKKRAINGMCIECGRKMVFGDIYLDYKQEGNILCLSCSNEGNVITDGVEVCICG